MPPLLDTILQPLRVLREAIDRVPFVKYALGVAGIGAAIAIIKAFGIQNYNVPLLSLLIFLGLMVLLFVFSALTKSGDTKLKVAGYILVYTVTLLTCLSAVLLVTSIFFKYPDRFENIVSPANSEQDLVITTKDLGLSVSMTKSDNSSDELTPDEVEQIVKIDPPITKTGKDERLVLKFKLPEKYKSKEYNGLQFNFDKDIYQNLSGDLLASDAWTSSELDGNNRLFKSETTSFPNNLTFEANYKTPNK